MALLSWIVFGLIVGIIANVLDPQPARGGILGTIVLGIVGALVGGFLGNWVLGIGISGFNLSSFLIAIAGSLLVLFLARAFTRSAV